LTCSYNSIWESLILLVILANDGSSSTSLGLSGLLLAEEGDTEEGDVGEGDAGEDLGIGDLGEVIIGAGFNIKISEQVY